jgi:FkbM family methyltransferase
MITDFRVSYAQNREDIILSGFFPEAEKGFYVDIGANDPIVDSVTKYFYVNGWRGLNVEPLSQHFKALQKDRPEDINVTVGIGEKNGRLVLREYVKGTGLSTFAETMKNSYEDGSNESAVEYIDHTVDIRPISSIFKDYKIKKISFMKVDVEGYEYEVLAGNDWHKFRPEVICIEANHVEKDWHGLLAKNGYTSTFFDGLNEYFTDDHTNRAKQFNYVDTMLLKNTVLSNEVRKELVRYEDAVVWLTESKVEAETALSEIAGREEKLNAELQAAQTQINNLQSLLNDVTPLRRHIFKHVKYRLSATDTNITKRLTRDGNYQANAIPISISKKPLQSLLAISRETDQKNFIQFGRARQQSSLLPVYKKTKVIATRHARRAINKVFKE